MSDEEIVKVVNTLVGGITPIADSHYDRKTLENICLLGNIIDTLVCRMGNIAIENNNSQYASVEECVEQITKSLSNIKSNIEEYLQDLK